MCKQGLWVQPCWASALTLVMAHIDFYLYNPLPASASHPLPSIYAGVSADSNAWCGQGLSLVVGSVESCLKRIRLPRAPLLITNTLFTARKHSLGQGNIFTGVSVILSMGGEGVLCMMSLPVWLPSPMHLLGVAIPGPMFLWGVSIREVSVQKRSLCSGGGVSVRRPSRIRKAGSTRPSGMHTCYGLNY